MDNGDRSVKISPIKLIAHLQMTSNTFKRRQAACVERQLFYSRQNAAIGVDLRYGIADLRVEFTPDYRLSATGRLLCRAGADATE